MPPEEDARAILRLALRHEQSLGASLDPAFAQENWGFLAQQCVENLLKGLIVLAGEQPPDPPTQGGAGEFAKGNGQAGHRHRLSRTALAQAGGASGRWGRR